MPAPETILPSTGHPALGHLNLMVDTFIANATIEDLRATIRGMLVSGLPGVSATFCTLARERLQQGGAPPSVGVSYFATTMPGGSVRPTHRLHDALARARSFYGAGLGFNSLEVLSSIVKSTVPLRWESEGEMADIMVVIDADIGQALQSCREEIEAGRVKDAEYARSALQNLRRAVETSHAEVEFWGGEIPFERASTSIEFLKI
ncbi:hypothetical protein HGRIS_007276 [Hohenbuehelia grisea]|uniref:Uncharacterized protein n=1 Tax=Hohenbuehelia grisea TaxID=104357 RepID=A0ABR3JBZ9_9AGAR